MSTPSRYNEIMKRIMDVHEELVAAVREDCNGECITPRAKSLAQRSLAQLSDAQLNLMKLTRITKPVPGSTPTPAERVISSIQRELFYEGSRHAGILGIAKGLFAEGHASRYVYSAIVNENSLRCTPMLSQEELRSIVKSAEESFNRDVDSAEGKFVPGPNEVD